MDHLEKMLGDSTDKQAHVELQERVKHPEKLHGDSAEKHAKCDDSRLNFMEYRINRLQSIVDEQHRILTDRRESEDVICGSLVRCIAETENLKNKVIRPELLLEDTGSERSEPERDPAKDNYFNDLVLSEPEREIVFKFPAKRSPFICSICGGLHDTCVDLLDDGVWSCQSCYWAEDSKARPEGTADACGWCGSQERVEWSEGHGSWICTTCYHEADSE